MKVVEINGVPYGSTGRIMFAISDKIRENGGECVCGTGFTWHKSGRNDNIMVGGFWGKVFHMILSRFTGYHGGFSKIATKKFLKTIDEFQPDIIHLHNLHGWYINIPMLFDYINQGHIPVVWTLHDCWSFTGQCTHFTLQKCDKWKTGCFKCPLLYKYPTTYVDNSKKMWDLKKRVVTGCDNLTVVTPSEWLANVTGSSFFKEKPNVVINNGINLNNFSSKFRKEKSFFGVNTNDFVILGVCMDWGYAKGLDVFVELAKRLEPEYRIILVGVSKSLKGKLPENIISVERTHNQQELASFYATADLFFNPTREENFPTVNIEALACGTPVLTFNTGGSPEIITDECGLVVNDNIDDVIDRITDIKKGKIHFNHEDCVKRATIFNEENTYDKYLEIYKKVLKEN